MKNKYFLQLVALSALWGASFLLTRIAAPVLGPNLMAASRMGLATLVLAAIMRVLKHPWPKGHWRELFVLGLVGVAGPHVLYAWASLHLPAGYGALLSVTSVLFGAFASAWMKEETLTPTKLMGCLLGFLGAALVVRLGPVHPSDALITSALVCTAAAGLSGVSTPLLKRATVRMEPLTLTAGMHAAALLMMLPGAIYDFPQAQFTLTAVLSVLVLGVATSGLAYWIFVRIMRHITPVAGLSSTFMSTGFGVLWSVIFLGEATGPVLYAGSALILLSCLLVTGMNPWRLSVNALTSKP
jgi:drug/metabolite transporter (DMT)-like permease